MYGGLNYQKQFKKSQKWQVGLNARLNLNYSRGIFYVNQDEGVQNTYYITATPSINFNYNSTVTFNTRYELQGNTSKYERVNYANQNSYRHTVGTDISVKWPKRMIFDINYGYSLNTQVAAGFPRSSNMLNLAATVLMLKKDRGQLKLSVYDLLDQNIAVQRNAWANSVSTSEQQILKRYFLLTYQIKLNSFK